MGELVIGTDDKIGESVFGVDAIESGIWGTIFWWGLGGFLGGGIGGGGVGGSGDGFAAEDEANVEWGLEDEEDGGAEEIEVIGFDPDLVDVIGDAESDELGVDFDELDFLEPAVKGIGADVRFEGRGDGLPNFHNARVF